MIKIKSFIFSIFVLIILINFTIPITYKMGNGRGNKENKGNKGNNNNKGKSAENKGKRKVNKKMKSVIQNVEQSGKQARRKRETNERREYRICKICVNNKQIYSKDVKQNIKTYKEKILIGNELIDAINKYRNNNKSKGE